MLVKINTCGKVQECAKEPQPDAVTSHKCIRKLVIVDSKTGTRGCYDPNVFGYITYVSR